jgi:hypothetical protein
MYNYKLSTVEYYLTEDKTQEEDCKIFKCSARSLLHLLTFETHIILHLKNVLKL